MPPRSSSGLQSVARVAAFAHGVLAAACQVAHAFIGCIPHAHRSEVARPGQPRQHHRVAAIGLHTVAAALGDRRRCDDFAVDTLRTQVPPDHEPARAGFVDHMQPVPLTDQPAQRLVQPDKVPSDAADVSDLAVAVGIRCGDVDAFLVNIQSKVQSARFLHGPPPCKFATT
jgi:hypothetical protein